MAWFTWRLIATRDKVDVDTFHKGIQYALEKLGKSKFGFERTAKDAWALGTSLLIISELRVLVLTKRHVGSGNEIVISLIQRHAHSTTAKRHLERHLCLHKTSGKLRNFLRMVSS